MNPERFQRIEQLYHAARERTAEERAALLAQTDPELRREVESLLAQRTGGEFLERPFAHQYETGGLRRVHVRGLKNVAKRVLVQAAACNLALILRSITKAGTPRGLAERNLALLRAILRLFSALDGHRTTPRRSSRTRRTRDHFSYLTPVIGATMRL